MLNPTVLKYVSTCVINGILPTLNRRPVCTIRLRSASHFSASYCEPRIRAREILIAERKASEKLHAIFRLTIEACIEEQKRSKSYTNADASSRVQATIVYYKTNLGRTVSIAECRQRSMHSWTSRLKKSFRTTIVKVIKRKMICRFGMKVQFSLLRIIHSKLVESLAKSRLLFFWSEIK